eukprot:s858_g16.t1
MNLSRGCTEVRKAVSVKECIGLCTSFQKLGCVLAWWIIAGETNLLMDRVTTELMSLWLHDTAKVKSNSLKRRGATFPLREGRLAALVEAYSTAALINVIEPAAVEEWTHMAWVYVAVCTLNHLAGERVKPKPGKWSPTELRAINSIEQAVARRCDRVVADIPTSEDLWQKDVGSRKVGYNGEEASICHELTWDQVLPGLPPEEHGGCIDAVNWVGARTREYLLNPRLLLKDENEVVLPKMPGKVHVAKGDLLRIAAELVRRNVCDWIPLDSVYRVHSTYILNGLFGVEKPSTLADGRPILRLIMNLTGSNSTQIQLEGGTTSLPSICSWQSIALDNQEELRLFQSDMCSAFYLFRLPSQWKPFLAFNVLCDGSFIGACPNTTYALACGCIPMGWLNSVGIMQEISESLLGGGRLSLEHRIARGQLLPPWMNELLDSSVKESRHWWHVYLDNYAGGERLIPSEQPEGARLCHEAAEAAWAEAGVVSSDKKRVSAATRAVELGAEIDGEAKTLGVSTEKLVKIIQATLWMLAQPYLDRKHVQIIAGRWMFVVQFRRPCMGFLQETWRFVNGGIKMNEQSRARVRGEFLALIFASPLMQCNLGAKVSPQVICTDASMLGGSVDMACDLRPEGRDFLEAERALERDRSLGTAPILIISLFNGVGGTFRAYDICGIVPQGRIAVELADPGNRITLRRWPGTILVKDVRAVNDSVVRDWSLKFLQVEEVHLWAGWPCVDLSAVKYGRKNLAGEQSSLFWEVPRIRDLLVKHFGSKVVLKHVLENVASMDESAAREISDYMGSWPYRLDCVDAVPMRRPRFAWTSEKIEGVFPDVAVVTKRYWKEVSAPCTYPETASWITPGYDWQGESSGAVFPTCLKSIPRDRPPVRPAGLEKCSKATVQRWREDSFRYPPYQYDDRFLLTTNSTWRLLNAEEKELLLGYGYKHTALAWSESQIKQNKVGFSDCRHQLLGDCFSIYSFVILAVACAQKFLPRFSYKFLAGRMGMAPGFRAHIRSQIPLCRTLSYGSSSINAMLFSSGVEMLNRYLLRRTNHTGSDVRVTTGEGTIPLIMGREIRGPRLLAGRFSRAERIRQRAKIHLDDAALTPQTQARYYGALNKLLPFVEKANHAAELDTVVCQWVRKMWAHGEPLLTIGDGLSALHFYQPWTKRQVPHAWKLFAIWRKIEVPSRAPPLTKSLVLAMAAYEWEQEHYEMAVAFRAMQLESTLCGILVVQLKPQLERLLRLPPEALTKEIKLTQDLLQLFIKYQIPSDWS